MDYRVEQLGGGVMVCVSGAHTFGTDSFLLSDFASPRRAAACDLGCGCGAVSLLWFRGGDAPRAVWAVDIQPEAVGQLRRSVALSGLEDCFFPVEADLRALAGGQAAGMPAGWFELVACNPPYHRPGTGGQSSRESDRVARHEILCTLDDVCRAAARLLKYGGRFCLCHLPARLTDVLCAMRAHGIEPKRLRMAHRTAGDAPWLVLAEGKRGGKPGLRIEPPLVMWEGGAQSAEMARIYGNYRKYSHRT